MFVIPAKAGTQLEKNWAPAFAGVTRWLAVLWLALIALTAPASAQTFPPLTGRVVDNAHLLSNEQVLDLTSKSAALEAQSGRQFVVATVPSLEGRTIEDYGYRLGRTWGIGRKGKDDGAILLVAPNEHKVRIETGYGARVFLTDAVSSVIVREAILPHFKQNPPDYGGGIEEGADQIIKQMSLPPEEAAKNVAAADQAQQKRQHSSNPLPALFWFFIIGFLLLSMMRRAGGRRYRSQRHGISPWVILWGLNELSRGSRGGGWGGGSRGGGGGWGGGGGFGGGGGSFGGGGASGSW
jgi:uncharacterized protein